MRETQYANAMYLHCKMEKKLLVAATLHCFKFNLKNESEMMLIGCIKPRQNSSITYKNADKGFLNNGFFCTAFFKIKPENMDSCFEGSQPQPSQPYSVSWEKL